jgi:glycosyltransferase involved in cell wall biosynthesis
LAGAVRILQLVQRPQRRGAEIFAHQLSETLEKSGHSSPIAYLYPAEGNATLPLREHDRVLAPRERAGLERAGLDPALLSSLRRWVREYKPEIVQLNGARTVKYGALLAALSPRRRWSLVYRNIGDPAAWVRGAARRFVFRHFVIPRMDCVVAVSQASLDRLREFYGQSVPAIRIPRGIDAGSLTPLRGKDAVRRALGTAEGAPVLASVGALGPEKCLERAISLLHALGDAHPGAELWLIGDGPRRPALAELAQQLGVADRVRFLGIRDDVGDLLNAADLLLLTSDTEGIPGVVLEAAFLARPAVATRVGGVEECIVDGTTGLLVDRDSAAELLEATQGLLADPARRQQMGLAAQQWAAQHFGIERIARAYEEVYVQLADRAARGSSRSPAALRPGPPPRLEVLFVIEGLGQGGTERSVAESLPALRQRGIETRVACLHRRSGALEEVLAGGFDVRFLPRGWWRRFAELRSLIRATRPSVVHTALPRTDVLGRLAAAGTGVPVLSSIVATRYSVARLSNREARKGPLRLLATIDGWTARHLTSHLHAVSEAARADVVQALRVPSERITMIRRGRDAARLGRPSAERKASARASLGLAAEEQVLANLGRHITSKGHRHLIEAVSRLRPDHPHLQALVAGREGPVTGRLREQLRELDLEGAVHLMGFRADAPEVLAAADIFVFPSYHEGMPGAVIEALALGLPVIAFDIPAVREVVAVGVNALLAPVGDAEALARHINALLDDPKGAVEMGARNRELYEREFTLEHSVRQMAELYTSLASGAGR